VKRYLTSEEQRSYLRPGFRIRIMNTWRPLNSVLEDRPLAFCDSRSIDKEDLMPTDRILPDRVGEVYYLQYNPHQQWCARSPSCSQPQLIVGRFWIDRQRNDEMAIFLAYDTDRKDNGARCESCPRPACDCHWLTNSAVCPHVSFDNPNAPSDAAKRESVECRSIVITKVI